MITIRPVYNEHKMTFSNPGSGQRGFSVMARGVAEIHEAIDHYFLHGKHKGLAGTGRTRKGCPLCREKD